MNRWPARAVRNVSTGTRRTGRDRFAATLVVLGLLAGQGGMAVAPPRPPAEPPMPDPCTTAPVLPFCR